MRKTIFYLMAAVLIAPVFSSCSDEPNPVPAIDNTDTTGDSNETPTNNELLKRRWVVDEAYVNGTTPDVSSKGLELDIKGNSAYTLFLKDGSTYEGTWKFIENETKVELDEGTQFHQTWTIQELSKTKLDVTFVSAFTQQNAQWILK